MKEIRLDNDLDRVSIYEEEHLELIAPLVRAFFVNNDLRPTRDNIELIATGPTEDQDEQFGNLLYWTPLSDALNVYFNNHP